MKTLKSNRKEKVAENLAKLSNPNKHEITPADKEWAAKMLEMDLQNQSGSIYQEEELQNPLQMHNEKMLRKMKAEKLPWTEN